jgi:hypothetical protein
MSNRSKLIVAAIALSAFATGSAVAHEAGIINQAGPYEQTMQFYLHPAHGFPGVAPAVQATGVVANTTKRADASSAVIPPFALKAVSTHSGPAKPAANKTKPSGRGAPLTLYVQAPAGNMVQLVHEPGIGWKYGSDRQATQRRTGSPLVQTALQEPAAPSANPSGDVEGPLTVFIDGPTGFTYVWNRDKGWQFVGQLSNANR